MTATRRDTDRTGFKPAATAGPCASCPWLVENHGKPSAHGWYTKTNLRRLWSGLRRGERMTCHKTDLDNVPLPGMKGARVGQPTRECTGAVILAQRELQRVNDVLEAGGGWTDYTRANPKGLTRDGASRMVEALLLGGVPLMGTLELARPNLNDDRVGYAELTPWVAK